MSEELKPCPFCGSKEVGLHKDNRIFLHQSYHGYPDSHNHGYRIECHGKCHAMTCWWHEEQQAISAWNKRAKI